MTAAGSPILARLCHPPRPVRHLHRSQRGAAGLRSKDPAEAAWDDQRGWVGTRLGRDLTTKNGINSTTKILREF